MSNGKALFYAYLGAFYFFMAGNNMNWGSVLLIAVGSLLIWLSVTRHG